jgi:hypothetical protein
MNMTDNMTDNQNMVLILSRFQLVHSVRAFKLETLHISDVQPHLSVAAACANVVLIKDGSMFAVLKHDFMTGVFRCTYHASTLNNIATAR